jgi:hypothetical protein
MACRRAAKMSSPRGADGAARRLALHSGLRLAALCAAFGAFGCFGGGAPETPDSNGAVQIVRETLDGWKRGEASKRPDVTVNEPRWEQGFTLESFEVAPETQVNGYAVRCQAELELKDPAGRPVKETASYDVTTSPVVTIIRVGEDW